MNRHRQTADELLAVYIENKYDSNTCLFCAYLLLYLLLWGPFWADKWRYSLLKQWLYADVLTKSLIGKFCIDHNLWEERANRLPHKIKDPVKLPLCSDSGNAPCDILMYINLGKVKRCYFFNFLPT